MRWILLLVGITLHMVVIGQSTLKIYVVDDDIRSDMDIIDLNTSALDRYGQSVDSTNMNYYTTTMATQVYRVNRVDLFGPEEEVSAALEDFQIDGAGIDVMDSAEFTVSEGRKVSNVQRVSSAEEIAETNPSKSIAVRSESNKPRTISSRSYRPKQKGKRPRKSRRNKRYKGQCPKFF